MPENKKAMVMAAFIADALSLGVHWVYNTNVIVKKFGRVESFLAPKIASYHRGKPAGAFTHYGDQTLLLLESIATAPFNLQRFADEWRSYMRAYDGYMDGATKQTLTHFEAGAAIDEVGSDSDDFGGAARIAPLVYRYADDEDSLATVARAQTALTHNHPHVIDAAEIFARAAVKALNGTAPVAALELAIGGITGNTPYAEWFEEGVDSVGLDTVAVIKDLGQMCEIEAAFPATVHLVAKYENDPAAGLIENVMAGGDSSARGLLLGLLLGACHGEKALLPQWQNELVAGKRIAALLDQVDFSLTP
jgi:ADP-ribosylglycohydrolase